MSHAHIICLSLSHHRANVETREKFAVSDSELPRRLDALREGGLEEALILSTCNRVEIYAAAADEQRGFDAIRGVLGTEASELFHHFSSSESVRHLFRVVSGLDSMVVGETEVLGQVKKAYGVAAESGGAARHLHKLFQRAFRVAKEVRTRTNIGRGSVSVGSVAVDLAEKIFGALADRKIVILGAGETSEQTARALLSRGARSIVVSNRRFERAVELAKATNGRAIKFDDRNAELADADIVISSTAAPHPIVTSAQVAAIMRARPDRPLFVIDLAVPRDVEAAINAIDGVYLYDIDALQDIASQSMALRRKELAQCEEIIDAHVVEFSKWLDEPGARGSEPGARRLAIS